MKPVSNNGPNPALKVATGFLLLFLFSGILFSVIYGARKVGVLPETVSAYYLGSEGEMTYPKELSELMETTHIHLFMIPLIFYILCHLFAQTSISARWRMAVIGLTFANIAGFLAAPYLIRFLSPGFALMIPVHDLMFVITAGVLTLFPLREIYGNKGSGK